MKHTIQNASGRPLTIICNSGKAVHMAPDYSFEVNELDVKTNSMIKKLLDKKLIRCAASKAVSESAKKSAAATKKDKTEVKAESELKVESVAATPKSPK